MSFSGLTNVVVTHHDITECGCSASFRKRKYMITIAGRNGNVVIAIEIFTSREEEEGERSCIALHGRWGEFWSESLSYLRRSQ